MKRKVLIALMIVSVLTECGNDTKKVSTETVKNTEKTETYADKPEETELDITHLEEIFQKFDDVKNVAYVSEDKLLVVADQMYVIDINSCEIVAKNADCDYVNGEIKIYCNDNNIVIVGKKYKDIGNQKIVFLDDADAPKQCVLYYDYQLNLVKNINIYDTFGLNPDSAEYVAVNQSGNLAVYDDIFGVLYLCDIDTKKKKKIFGKRNDALVYDHKLQFTISGGIAFAENDERIVFKAECRDYSAEEGRSDVCGIGSVRLDGKEYEVTKAGDEYTKLEVFNHYAMLSQDCGYTIPTGKVIKYMIDTNCAEMINLKTKEESESLYCAKNGNIVATSEKSKENHWNIRFYDATLGELISEKRYDALPLGNYREPKIYVFEKYNIALLYWETEDENSKDAFGFVQYSKKK